MKLVVGTFVTVDGIMQAPGAPDEDRDGGFEQGGWLVPHFDGDLGEIMDALNDESDAVLFGRKSHAILASHWPHVGDDDPMAAKLNSVPKYVASRTGEIADWANSTLLEGDVAEAVAKLKEEADGVLGVIGSADLIQTLLRHDLVDEFQLIVAPVVVGDGKRLFGEGTIPRTLRLVDTKVTGSGIAVHRYERVGELEYGAFGLETEAGSAGPA
jgi:dihydrofolate reductase